MKEEVMQKVKIFGDVPKEQILKNFVLWDKKENPPDLTIGQEIIFARYSNDNNYRSCIHIIIINIDQKKNRIMASLINVDGFVEKTYFYPKEFQKIFFDLKKNYGGDFLHYNYNENQIANFFDIKYAFIKK
jgi:hypothetical protein